MRLSLAEILQGTGGRSAGGPRDGVFGSYHTDSREVEVGGVFFALKGAQLDGHSFVAAAFGRGAACAVVERVVAAPPDVALVVVDDAWAALYSLAASVLATVSPVVVGVTGSNGKTSTKELCAAALGVRYRVLKTEGNLNTETGVPLTLLRLQASDQAAVVEMGMQGPGEIARLATLARPLVGVVTGIGSVHAEYFADGRDGIARAKAELLEALPADGLAVVNADDPYFDTLAARSAAPVTGYGLESGDVRADSVIVDRFGSDFCVDGVRVRMRLSGRHQVRNAVGALAAARFLGVPPAEAAEALSVVSIPHRLEERELEGGATLIDDSYNASPESMEAAFTTVASLPRRGRMLALLGEMRELGKLAPEAHVTAGRRAKEVFDRVAVVDVGEGRRLAEAAGAELLSDGAAAERWVTDNARPGDIVLVKASHGVRLDLVVEALLGGSTRQGSAGP